MFSLENEDSEDMTTLIDKKVCWNLVWAIYAYAFELAVNRTGFISIFIAYKMFLLLIVG